MYKLQSGQMWFPAVTAYRSFYSMYVMAQSQLGIVPW
jgi:hypothetical protein